MLHPPVLLCRKALDVGKSFNVRTTGTAMASLLAASGFFFCEGPDGRRYGRTAALTLTVQRCDKDYWFFFRFSV
jgi:hypothetical protein